MSSVSCLQTGSFGALLDKWMEKKKDMHGKAEQERIKKWQQEKGENPVSEIVKLLKRGESEKVEFKESVSQMDKIVESISAFSNTNGGTIVIGVSDKRKVVGVDIGKRTIKNLANRIKQNTDPKAYPSIHVEKPFFQKESFTKEKLPKSREQKGLRDGNTQLKR